MAKKIYLAGKIGPGDWRHGIVSDLRDAVHDEDQGPWPILSRAIWERFDYVGPFFISCDHGGFHGPASHGVGANENDVCCGTDGVPASVVVQRCLDAVEKADLFYAWLDDVTAFGTLVEIGYASGRARQHSFPIFVATPPDFPDEAELWFALQLHGVTHIRSGSPAEGLRHALAALRWAVTPPLTPRQTHRRSRRYDHNG